MQNLQAFRGTLLYLFPCFIVVIWFDSLTLTESFIRSASFIRPTSVTSFSEPLCLAKKSWQPPSEEVDNEDPDNKGFAYSVELNKRAGISWGSDLSFRFIYVLDLEPTGDAYQSGLVEKVDDLVKYKFRLSMLMNSIVDLYQS